VFEEVCLSCPVDEQKQLLITDAAGQRDGTLNCRLKAATVCRARHWLLQQVLHKRPQSVCSFQFHNHSKLHHNYQLYYHYYLFASRTHTHPFNGPFSETAWVSQYQKGKTDLDFTEARVSEWQWHQLGHMQVCTLHLGHLVWTDNYTSTPPLCFLHAGCPSCHPTNSIKALKASRNAYKINKHINIICRQKRTTENTLSDKQ